MRCKTPFQELKSRAIYEYCIYERALELHISSLVPNHTIIIYFFLIKGWESFINSVSWERITNPNLESELVTVFLCILDSYHHNSENGRWKGNDKAQDWPKWHLIFFSKLQVSCELFQPENCGLYIVNLFH